MFAGALGEGNLVLGVILVRQVLQNTTRLKQPDLLTIGELIGQSGNPAIGVDLKEPAAYRLVADEITLHGDTYSSFCSLVLISIFFTS